jgi:7,8-dihydroneopterin aldolase/epimerase/oxygenase
MDRIAITGLEVFGHHGVLPHERELGQRFVIDVVLGLDLTAAASSDDLANTVDYGQLTADVAAIVGGDPADLLESVAGRIVDRCLRETKVDHVEVTVHKPAAPLPAAAREVAVTLRRSRT